MTDETNPYRLPRTVLPRRYALELTPDLVGATFTGSVAIEVDVHEGTDVVVLNAIELEVPSATVVQGGVEQAATVALDPETERLTLTLAEPLVPGEAVVQLGFRGTLNDKLRGFYRSTFTDAQGAEQVIATTQFEATDARRAFPCWDEPDCKAVFAITLHVEPGTNVVSNAAVVSDELDPDGLRAVRFADSMSMSTYLVAFVVGPLEISPPTDVDGTPLRIVHPPGKGHLTAFGAEVADFSLRYLADYFALPYAGDSMDLVAIPDFAFGAMENVGCVTFRETLLLADPSATTQGEQQNVVDVIAHELAHMWFGNLVTMRWWNGIWLNEAFATFMEMKVTDAFRPDWKRWSAFGLSRSQAFDTDALAATRPIEYPVISPADAEGMFDILTYEKGAAVVRMLEQYLGEERFRDGIRKYMSDHAYGNTETTDLWDAIEAASGEPVRRIMDSWIFQGGHPIVHLDLDADGRVAHLSQERFRYLADDDTGPAPRWAIPVQLRYGTAGGATHTASVLLDGDHVDVELAEPATWVVGNAEGHGFYRVRPAAPISEALVAHAHSELSDVERYSLVDDTWASVLAGTTDPEAFLVMAEGFGAETDAAVWRRLVGGLGEIDRCLAPERRPAFQARVAAIVAPALGRLGWEARDEEPSLDRELRALLIGALVTLAEDPDATARAREVFSRIRAGEAVEPNLAGVALRAVAAVAGADELDELEAGFRSGGTPQEEQRYLFAMADVRDPALFERVLALATSTDVRTQNAPYLLGTCLANRDNGPTAWAAIRDDWDQLNQRFPSNSIARMINGIRAIHDPSVAADVERFLAEHPLPQGRQAVAQHLERMRVEVALAERLRSG